MRVLLQRVSSARVTVEGRVTGEIGRGLLLLQGVAPEDTPEDGAWLAQKIAKLRIFADDSGLMNRSVTEVGGGILLVSQFTLFASTRKGTRPSFNDAAPPDLARSLYAQFQTQLAAAFGAPVQTGEFGALMQVELVNDGPVTLLLDSKARA